MTGASLLERILLGIAGLTVFVLLFFFLAAALVVGTVVVLVFLARLWWLKRRLQHAQEAQEITTEYTVIERESVPPPQLPDDSHPKSRMNAERPSQNDRYGP